MFLRDLLRHLRGPVIAILDNSTTHHGEALAELQRSAARYPRDRVVWNQIGRVLFLQRSFDEAISALQKVLAIDPEDLQAHYNLMLCYQCLGNQTLAAREQALYERFKADEASQSITGGFRLSSPHDNNERQAIHEHRSGSVPAGVDDERPRRSVAAAGGTGRTGRN